MLFSFARQRLPINLSYYLLKALSPNRKQRITMRIIIACFCLLAATATYAQDNLIFRNGTELPVKVLEVSPSQLKYRRQDNLDGPVYTISVANLLLVKYANGTKDVFGASTQTPVVANPSVDSPTLSTQPGLEKLRYHSGLFSRYFVGSMGEPISRTEVRSLLANHHDALQAYRHGQSYRKWAVITAVPAVALLGVGAGVALAGHDRFGFRDRNQGPSANTPMDNDGRHPGFGRDHVGMALVGGGVLLGVASLVLDHKATRQFRRAASRYNQHQQTVGLEFGPSSKGLGVGMTLTF
eukprot:TRINITY_DN7298_c0_g1_i1.p1 TRINITY_DN7298_c0_g1~~TRINITY_DN7298_c0_g1_i1.p1  ORF type:complete len:296 (+),score=-29.46 TRINITY_DN7298_c0_g1_i1:511-1398(+)